MYDITEKGVRYTVPETMFTIKQARQYAGFTQREMARRLKIDRSTYIRIEHDVSRATVAQITQISRETGVPMRCIFLQENSTMVE